MDAVFTGMLAGFFPALEGEHPDPDTPLRDLGLDSLRAMELLELLEARYGVTVPDELLGEATFDTAGTLWAVIDAAVTAPAR